MRFPCKEAVERLRREYPAGCRVELLRMDDPQAPAIGTRGTVTGVDDSGSIMAVWAAFWRVMLFISTSTPMVCFFISAIWFFSFSFMVLPSVFCVFPFGSVLITLNGGNSKLFMGHNVHKHSPQDLVYLRCFIPECGGIRPLRTPHEGSCRCPTPP